MPSDGQTRKLDIVGEGPFLDAPHPETLVAILNTAAGILWTSDVEGQPGWNDPATPLTARLRWKPRVLNEAGAQQVLPLEIRPGSNYFEAWRDSRHREDDQKMWETSVGAFLSGAPSYHQVFRCFDKYGLEHWIREEVRITHRGPGLWYVVGLATDVTSDWQATQEVARINQRLQQAIQHQRDSDIVLDLVLDCVPVGVALVSRDGRFVRVNREFCRLSGNSPSTLTGQHITRWVDPVLADALESNLQIVQSSPEPTPMQELLLQGSEGMRVCELRLYPINLQGSEALAAGVLLADVTESRQAQKARIAKEVAESANAAKDRFLAMLSHELRMPLTPVLALASTLEDDARLPEDVRRDMSIVLRNTQLEARLIEDLLDHTRVVRGAFAVNRSACDLHDIARRTLEMLHPQIEGRQLQVRLQLDATSTRLDADPVRLQQVVANLLNNAQKFTRPGGRVVLHTANATLNDSPAVLLEVEDNGIGIAPETLPLIFEPFEQGLELHSSQRQAGLGLGLAISKHIVEAHGGTIAAESPGRDLGSVFRILLPLAAAPAPGKPAAPTGSSVPANLAILLVEDHADTARVLQKLLCRLGHEVTLAGSVAQALEALKAKRFDIIISDLGLPDGTGREVAARRPPGTPAIALSGFGSTEDLRQSKEAGFSEHLIKPVAIAQLRDAIARCVQDVRRTTP